MRQLSTLRCRFEWCLTPNELKTADNGAMYSEKETVQAMILEIRQYPVWTDPIEGTTRHYKRVFKPADKRFMVIAVECRRLIKSDKNGRLVVVETGEDITSDFE